MQQALQHASVVHPAYLCPPSHPSPASALSPSSRHATRGPRSNLYSAPSSLRNQNKPFRCMCAHAEAQKGALLLQAVRPVRSPGAPNTSQRPCFT